MEKKAPGGLLPRAGCPTRAPCLRSSGYGAGCGLVQLELPLHHRLAVSTGPSGHLSSRLGQGAAPPCQVPARQRGRGHGGQREQLLLISGSALQRAVCGCPFFHHFCLPSLILISTKEPVNHRTREAQFFYFLVIIRGLRVRDSFRLKVTCQPRRLASLLWSFVWRGACGPQGGQGSPLGSFPGSKSVSLAPAACHGDVSLAGTR